MSDDIFEGGPDENDLREQQERKEVMFEIESRSTENKEAAYKLLVGMYKRHLLILFSASVVAAVLLFIGFIILGTVLWGSISNPVKTAVIAGGALCFPAGNILLICFLERYLFSRDAWSLDRLGYRGITGKQTASSLLYGCIPVAFVVIALFDPATALDGSLANPAYLLLIFALPFLAIFEEILFRGIYWKYLDMKYSRVTVILVSSLIFAFIHLPAFFFMYVNALLSGVLFNGMMLMGVNLLSIFFSGVTLAVLRHVSQNLIAPTAFHVVYNVVVAIIVIQPLLLLLANAMIAGVIFVISMFYSVQVVKKEKAPSSISAPLTETREYKNFKFLFLAANATVIIYYTIMMTEFNPVTLLAGTIAVLAILGTTTWLLTTRSLVVTHPGSTDGMHT